MKCMFCKSDCIKKGFQKNGKQKYRCTGKCCGKYQQQEYRYNACKPGTNSEIIKLVQRGNGIRDISFIREISATTVIRRIRHIAYNISPPAVFPHLCDYQMDEVHTYIWENNRKKPVYLAYAINKQTRQVVYFTIGNRTKYTLNKTVSKIISNYPKSISTDCWKSYPSIIPKDLHIKLPFKTNTIERNHLTVRTQQKRLSNNRLCHSKKVDMLEAFLKIYFWTAGPDNQSLKGFRLQTKA